MRAWILKERAKHCAQIMGHRIADNHLDAQGGGACVHNGDVLRVAVFIDKEGLGF